MKKLWQSYLSLSRLQQIAIGVLAAHAVCFFALCLHHLASFRPPPKHPILVRTQTPVKQIAATPKPPAKAPSKPAAKPTPPVKPAPKEAPKKETKKPTLSPTPTKKAPPKESPKPKESVSAPPPAKELPIPKRLPQKMASLQNIEEKDEELPVQEQLIAFLQNTLELPEYGEVKVRLEFDRWGTLKQCTILEAKSPKNSEFLKNRLPELVFPCFNDKRLTQEPLVFTITFYNVEMR